jgi:vancomycin aglycone glucosyltransferase
MGGHEVRVLLSTYDSRGGVEPLVGLAVRLRAPGAEAWMCAPPDCAERLAAVGVHHGGTGTTTAARAGAPQVVVPHWADQPHWAGR